ncbi:MAG: hypothetical protein AB1486_03895 [Planctomycetota bacterium]
MKSWVKRLSHGSVVLWIVFLATATSPTQDRASGTKSVDEWLAELPAGLVARGEELQTYRVTSILHNRDLTGNVLNKLRLTAEYSRRTEDGGVHCRWSKVRLAAPPDPSKPFPEGELLDFMEGFSYVVTEEIAGEALYRKVPDENTKHLVKTLVWDAATFEPFFWDHFDQFRLNEQLTVSELEDFDVQKGDWGKLKLRDLRMAWIGISEKHDETCALIKYESFSNPVHSDTEVMNVNGRSLYWGCLWISLEDKQVEHATLNEDVFMEITSPGGGGKRMMDMQREVVFDRID